MLFTNKMSFQLLKKKVIFIICPQEKQFLIRIPQRINKIFIILREKKDDSTGTK